MEDTIMAPAEEGVLDFSQDSAVEERQLTFVITAAELKSSNPGPKGSGHYYAFTFESPDLPFAVTTRYFTDYASVTGSLSDGQTRWLAQQRGAIKRLAIAALDAKGRWSNTAGNPLYIVGRSVLATTVPDDQDRLTLGRFKKVA